MKTKNKIKIGMIMLSLILVLPMISAGMYETLQSFESRSCSYLNPDGVSFSALQSKFGLVSSGGDDCIVVLDTAPVSVAYDFGLGDPWYATTTHLWDGATDYLFILGKNVSTLNEMIGFITNYEIYQPYIEIPDETYPYFTLASKDSIFLFENFLTEVYDPLYTGVIGENCVMDGVDSVYLGNGGSYDGGSFSPSCIDENILEYGFCISDVFWEGYHSCDCQDNKCVASFNEIYSFFSNFGSNSGPGGRLIDEIFISSAVSSWIDN